MRNNDTNSNSSKISTSKFGIKNNNKEPKHPTGYTLVNFQKFRHIAKLIRKFISFQSPNHMYNCEYIPSIFQKCQYLYILEDDIMKELCEEYESNKNESRTRSKSRSRSKSRTRRTSYGTTSSAKESSSYSERSKSRGRHHSTDNNNEHKFKMRSLHEG
jgi:hypothetical protein